MREIDDCRKKDSSYELAAHLTACLAMFLFKSKSRNGYNNLRADLRFQQNYKKLFNLPMPHGDSVNNVIENLEETQLEILKEKMVKALLERKIFHKNRYLKKWFRVAVDGSGAVSYKYEHSRKCLHKTSKNGKKSYFYAVLEARLVTPNGFSISLATEWIENPEGEYDKQDCERKAFKRLATKLKKAFPKLPIIILADGLYPYEGFFSICEENQWAYQCTFKEGNLKTVWDEVQSLSEIGANKTLETTHYTPSSKGSSKQIVRTYQWINTIEYNGRSINWLQCHEIITWTEESNDGTIEEKSKEATFVHITNLEQNEKIIAQASSTGRLRWKIENKGFNTLKNGGYGMQHKWSRKSYQALKNYFQFMQMAYLINQLMVKRASFQEQYLGDKNHPTLKNIWENLIAAMKWLYNAITMGNPMNYQFSFCHWSLNIIRGLLEKERNIKLSKSSMSRLLNHLGLSPQKPLYKSYKQDPQQIKDYLSQTYPEAVAEAKKYNARLYFIDEAAFRSDVHRGTTWGKVGKTPVIKDTGGGVSALS